MKILAINKSYSPVRLCSRFNAIGKMFTGNCNPIFIKADGSFSEHTWEEWLLISLKDIWPEGTEFIQAVKQRIALPKVIRYVNYDKIPRITLRLNRRAIYDRDDHTCYLCGERYSESRLSVDHVIPSSKGGKNTFENMATCCKRCNGIKGSKTLAELKIKPKFMPYKPTTSNIQRLMSTISEASYQPEWKLFGL